ncbi:eukaryotic translation initiation factor 5B isoform X2 [Selaginella moellendorffii]|uniref:eukaryotic translation initiation factor 5B isoform X2 n=1 Tax=Selaginella moellendorffii TaxID=88036 RepID=UPI000D1D10C7|nr:eukaryotic translation initiation factor 5B isoform X2 [Selaginella moellendorffii]XP_024525109.1 eukaryotic translation initiation factor 5B isoform X2 [Selaginella moellendorffii]XP_024525110.1 eukaryotic translation initiation factor 5B isoform X2 [Selaginella moellendorffii]|eukprot:XP_024525108.1 eukaryotic translation initiation factor 5B isoform X2 [Selaginella moellendorffii]
MGKKGKKVAPSLDDYWNEELNGDGEAVAGSTTGASVVAAAGNDEDLVMEMDLSKSKRNKKKDDLVAPALALDRDDEEEEEEKLDLSGMKKKKPKKKKDKILEEDTLAPSPASTPPDIPLLVDEEEEMLDLTAAKKKKAKKKDKKKILDDDYPEVAAQDWEVPSTAQDDSSRAVAAPEPAAAPTAPDIPSLADEEEEMLDLTAAKKKKPKKKDKKKILDDDYPEVAAQDWEVPSAAQDDSSRAVAAPEPTATPDDEEEMLDLNKKKKKKKKQDDRKKTFEEELAEAAAAAGVPESEVPAAAAPDEEEDKLDLTGAKKKKSKKKKQGEKKAEETVEVAVPDVEGEKVDAVDNTKGEETTEATGSSKKKKKKGPLETQEAKPKVVEKKVPKHIREMQERLAKIKEEEERRKREEEERLRKEEEERLRLEEEERLREEAKQRRKQREKEKIKEKKAKGLYLTGKQKMEARRLAMIKEQILASSPALVGEEQSPTPRKPKYETKKKKVEVVSSEDVKPDVEESEAAAEVQSETATEAQENEPEVENEPEGEGQLEEEAEEEEEEEDEDDDWEAKSWDDESKLPTVKDAFADEDEEEEEQVVPEKLVKVAPKVEEVPSPQPPKQPAISREARMAEALTKRSADDLRSPICCILGHVDTGKTKLLDCIRRTNVQEGEAGGITQQIGATYFPMENIRERTKELPEAANMRVPGLLVIDTPGHESFTNLRSRGSGLCDIAILVIDIMHGLEPQTIESINLLRMRKTPFIVALNKVDRLYQWKPRNNAPIRTTLQEQERHTKSEFETRTKQIMVQLQEQSLNSELYWKNKDKRKAVSIIPTSAISGEGIPDLLYLLVLLTQEMMEKKLMYVSEVECTVLEVKVVEGLGTTIDVVLVNGVLHEGDQIVVCGMQGPIVTTIRALLTPHPMKELRVKGSYQHHKELKAAQGIKITAQGLEHAIAGTQLYVVGEDEDVETIKEEAMKDMKSVMGRIDKSGEGVCVQASTLGSLEALLEFLKTPDVNIPVSGISIGPVHKKDIMRASVMLERKKEYATILAFDVKVTPEARELAEELGVKIFTADIIYHLFDQFTAYLKNTREEKRRDTAEEAIFPCILKILPNCVFNKKDPIIVGVVVLDGFAKVGTPICVPSKDGEFIDLGRIASLEINHKVVDVAKKGEEVAMKIMGDENQKMFGRHFDYDDLLVSHITRRSIDVLKENYRTELSSEEWKLIMKLKGIFRIL